MWRKLYVEDLHTSTRGGRTAFLCHILLKSNHFDFDVIMTSSCDVTTWLRHTVDVIYAHAYLDKYAHQGLYADFIKEVLNNDLINRTDQNGHTPLIAASARNFSVVISELIEMGSDVNYKDPKGASALMYAWLLFSKTRIELYYVWHMDDLMIHPGNLTVCYVTDIV